MSVDIFYSKLLERALNEIEEHNLNTIVFGPLRTQTEEYSKYVSLFENAQTFLRSKGYLVFNQIPYLDINIKGAPFDFEKKSPIFFGGIISSGLITDAYFMKGWELSQGSHFEHDLCMKNNITIHYL
jgi:hypothetical protein